MSPTPSAPPSGAWVRLGLLLGLAVTWLLPWADVTDPVSGRALTQIGAARTGIAALGALVWLWGLSLTALVARTRAGLLAGEAFTAAGLCAVAATLLLEQHAWLATGERAAALLPVFVPLGLLAVLDGAMRLKAAGGGEIAAVRVGAGVFAAASLLADEAPAAAGMAFLASAGPLAFLAGRTLPAAQRSLDLLITLGALVAGFAPTLQRQLALVPDTAAGLLPSAIAWSVLAALVVLTGASGLFAPAEPPSEPGPSSEPATASQ